MRFKNTWVLLAIAIVFVVYFFVVEQPRHKKELQTAEQISRFTQLTRENIHYLTIQRHGETIEFTREGGGWRILSPVVDIADRGSVNTLISSVVDAGIERKLRPEESDFSSFGLGETDKTKLILRTSTRDTSLTIYVGNHNVTKSHFYARRDTAHEILLLPAGIRRYALWDLSEFREKKVIDFLKDDVKKFEIVSAERTLRWERDNEGRWVAVQEGDTIRGDMDEITSILSRLRGLRVEAFISDDPDDVAAYFPEPKKTIKLWLGEEQTLASIFFGDKNPDSCFAKPADRNRITLVDPRFLHSFNKTYNDLRDRHMLRFDKDAASMIRLETSDTTATIIKAGGKWAFANPALGTIGQRKMNILFLRLERLMYTNITLEHFKKPIGYGISAPYFKLTLFDWEENIIDQLLCGSETESGKTRYATSLSSGVLAEVDIAELEELQKAFHGVRQD